MPRSVRYIGIGDSATVRFFPAVLRNSVNVETSTARMVRNAVNVAAAAIGFAIGIAAGLLY